MSQAIEQRNQDATCYCGNLDDGASEELLWELMLQAGPVINVHMPRDKITSSHQGYGFVEFRSEEDAEYAIKVLNMVKFFGKPLRVNKASQDRKEQDIGANLFIGQLDPEVRQTQSYLWCMLHAVARQFGDNQSGDLPVATRRSMKSCYTIRSVRSGSSQTRRKL